MIIGSGAEHDPKEMGFLDHLEELRWVLIRSGIALIIAAIVMFNFSEFIFEEILVRPLHLKFPELNLIFLRPAGKFLAMLNISLWAALLIGLPYVTWEFWRFVIPGLFKHERKLIPVIIFLTVLCFAAGTAMAYFIIIPYALQFFLNFGSDIAVPQLEIKEYISFTIRMCLAFGIIFELPVVSFFLSRVGLVTPELLRKIRAYAIFTIAVLSAFITPQDPVTMLLAMGPLVILYEISILVAKIGKRRRESESEFSDED